MSKIRPETSIVIRTYNESGHIGNLLKAIRSQEYGDYEIVIVDSGSTDDTLTIAGKFTRNILKIESRDFTFGYSLNTGCRKARGKYIVLVSAHVVPVNNKWLGILITPFKDPKTGMVYGRQIGGKENKFSERMDLERIFKKSPYPNNANSAFRKDIWEKKKFNEYLFGLEDIEFAREVSRKGFLVKYEPKAAVFHIHEEKWPQVFNRYRREAIAAAKMGLERPLQAQTGFFWLAGNIFQDLLASFPNVFPERLEEIGRFRYYQWKGTRQGWLCDSKINLNNEKQALFYPAANKAVVIKNKNQATLEEIPLPKMKPRDILIKVNYVGVCRTDFEVYGGSLGYYKKGLARYPIVPGHEFSGTIATIGANNKYQERFRVGERVVGECILSRGDDRKEVGVINYNGAYGQFIVIPGNHIHKIPKSLDSKTACLAEPLAVVLRALKRIKHCLGRSQKIAVIGAGSIGNLCSQVLADSGYQVAVFDKNQERLAFLKKKTAVSTKLANLQDFDILIEATGNAGVLEKVLKESKEDAVILLLGFPYGKINYNFEDVVGKEKIVAGSVGGGYEEFEEALELLPKLDTAIFTNKVLPLEDFKKAWQAQRDLKNLKVILKP